MMFRKGLMALLVAAFVLVGSLSAFAGNISGFSAPASGTAASVTIAATGTGAGNLIEYVSAAMTGTTSVSIYVRDGATGTGTIKWQITLPGAAGVWTFPMKVLGSPNTATTVEFSAGSLVETLSVNGVTQ